MCGIAGWFSNKVTGVADLPSLENMAAAIAHRGPDGQGYECIDHAAFAHRRLSIIGLDSGAQPMFSWDNSCAITFNGEIYNYKSLRRELVEQGARFRTDTDTEVILQLYLQQGIEGFSSLRGMYAFALWDQRRQKGYLVRDPLGIKPLFYRRSAINTLEFGSEVKAILARNRERAELSERTLHLLLNFRYIPDETTLFDGIDQLEPGAILEWSPDGVIARTKIMALGSEDPRPLLELLQSSVSSHLVSDVEVGAYLSGGVDSATIVALARRVLPGSLRTFTANVGDDPFEAINAADTARFLGVDNIPGDIEGHASARLGEVIWSLEMPKVNALQVSALARHAAGHVKVALSGLGGDELFLGYNAHRWMSWCHGLQRRAGGLAALFGTLFHPLVSRATPLYWSEFERANLVAKNIGSFPRVYGLLRNVWDSPAGRRQIYGPRMLDQALPDAFEWLENHWPGEDDPVMAMREFEWRRKMVNDLLWQEDRCSMAEGLEVRVPFVDGELKAAVWPLQRRQLMINGELKGILKQAVKPILPQGILGRKKSGFQVEAPSFFRNELMELSDHYLSPSRVADYGLFNPTFIKRVLSLGEAKMYRWHYFMLYLMLGTHMWLELFEERSIVSAK